MELNTMVRKKNYKVTSILLLLTFCIMWLFAEKSMSYSEPQEALMNAEDGLVLIPAYKFNDESLFFFIKNSNLGASFIQKGLFGWKSDWLTYSQMGEITLDKINGVKGHGDNLIYGLVAKGNYIKVNGIQAEHLYLDIKLDTDVVKQYSLENTTIWYFVRDTSREQNNIELFDTDTDERLDYLLEIES